MIRQQGLFWKWNLLVPCGTVHTVTKPIFGRRKLLACRSESVTSVCSTVVHDWLLYLVDLACSFVAGASQQNWTIWLACGSAIYSSRAAVLQRKLIQSTVANDNQWDLIVCRPWVALFFMLPDLVWPQIYWRNVSTSYWSKNCNT